MPSELVEEKRRARVRRSLFPKVLTLTHNDKKSDCVAIEGASLPRVPPHMDLLRHTCMRRAQVCPY